MLLFMSDMVRLSAAFYAGLRIFAVLHSLITSAKSPVGNAELAELLAIIGERLNEQTEYEIGTAIETSFLKAQRVGFRIK